MFKYYLLCALLWANSIQALPRALPDIDDNSIESNEDDLAIDLSNFGSKIFGTPDNETGKAVAEYDPNESDVNPEELGNYLEGDMLVPSGMGRSGLVAYTSRWPGAVVPFEIRGNFDAYQMSLIEQAINEYHRRTCIRFRPRLSESDYISIVSGNSGCWSSVGRMGGRQEVNLQVPGCTTKIGTILHEFMHAVGFLHEQNRSDRDEYITVNWGNIRPGTQSNFDKASAITTSSYGVEYDYGSVMHYSANAFSRNGQATISPKRYVYYRMGQRDGFSQSDVDKINQMYNCPAMSTNVPYPYETLSSEASEEGSGESTPATTTRRPNYPVLSFLGNLATAAATAALQASG